MEERRKGNISSNGGLLREREEEDFLDVILSKQNLTDEEIVSIVLDIMLGGYETTATLMSLIVYFLGHAPFAFHKLKVTVTLSLILYLSTCIYTFLSHAP